MIPHRVAFVGSEEAEELLQDATSMTAPPHILDWQALVARYLR